MIYRTKNPKGADCTYFLPYVKLSPNGDYALKGDEWQQIPLSVEVLKPTNAEAIYRDGDHVADRRHYTQVFRKRLDPLFR